MIFNSFQELSMVSFDYVLGPPSLQILISLVNK